MNSHYPEYDTITTLKSDAMDENYRNRIENEVKKMEEMFLKRNADLEI